MSTTLHCTEKLGAHEPHEWTTDWTSATGFLHTSCHWCPGVKPGPLLDLAVSAVEHAERRLADALAALRHVSVKHRRTYDEAIMAHDEPLDLKLTPREPHALPFLNPALPPASSVWPDTLLTNDTPQGGTP